MCECVCTHFAHSQFYLLITLCFGKLDVSMHRVQCSERLNIIGPNSRGAKNPYYFGKFIESISWIPRFHEKHLCVFVVFVLWILKILYSVGAPCTVAMALLRATIISNETEFHYFFSVATCGSTQTMMTHSAFITVCKVPFVRERFLCVGKMTRSGKRRVRWFSRGVFRFLGYVFPSNSGECWIVINGEQFLNN